MRNIVLVGLSGSGKTTLGRMAAKALDLPFIDLDEVVEGWMGMHVKGIFEAHGEDFFRELEAQAVREVSAREGAVLATGGGAVLREENVRALRANGLVIFLDRPVKQIITDIACDGRPLLADGAEKLFALFKTRQPLYLQAAHVHLQNNGGVPEALAGLLAAIRAETIEDGYAVIGEPIAHTLSPCIHETIFTAVGVEAMYRAVHVPKGRLGGFIERIRTTGVRGLNVTIPHKQAIIPLLDEVEDAARQCGAVNTVIVNNGKLYGYNTDMDGLLISLRDQGYAYAGKNIVILGSGGAARGIVFKAAREGAKEIIMLGRHIEKAEAIKNDVQKHMAAAIFAGMLDQDSIAEAAGHADILINTTPLGMSGIGEDFVSLAFLKALPPDALVCDLIYNPLQTELLKEAAVLGLKTLNGLAMLINQALLADELFLGRVLDKAALFKAVSHKLLKMR